MYAIRSYYGQRESAIPVSDYTVEQAMEKYIESRSNILSPSTIQGYKKIKNNNLQSIMDIKVKKLSQNNIQSAVNADAKTLSAIV